MKVHSFTDDGAYLTPIEVEINLLPGLPQIQFLGLPDQNLKESALRIKSAIRASGFQFPTSHQVIVNLRPSYIKKNSKGIELAVASLILWATEQVPLPTHADALYIYGELGLDGTVSEPVDLERKMNLLQAVVLTGEKTLPASNVKNLFEKHWIQKLSDLATPYIMLPTSTKDDSFLKRPNDFLDFPFSVEQSEILKWVCAGEHSVMLAGPSGSGKSAVASSLVEFLRAPSRAYIQEMQAFHSQDLQWRPVRRPHHSTPAKSILGGGSQAVFGEISRAHGGVLILDEMLEFSGVVQESLREPMEEGVIRIPRLGKEETYPTRCLFAATTNLCPCGDWTPTEADACRTSIISPSADRKPHRSAGANNIARLELSTGGEKKFSAIFNKKCNYSLTRCRSYRSRLSGPFLDRFDLLFFTKPLMLGARVRGEEILSELLKTYSWVHSGGRKSGSTLPARYLTEAEILADLQNHNLIKTLPTSLSSQRRRMACMRVARTLADLERSSCVEPKHFQKALSNTQASFQNLFRGDA